MQGEPSAGLLSALGQIARLTSSCLLAVCCRRLGGFFSPPKPPFFPEKPPRVADFKLPAVCLADKNASPENALYVPYLVLICLTDSNLST